MYTYKLYPIKSDKLLIEGKFENLASAKKYFNKVYQGNYVITYYTKNRVKVQIRQITL
jgi:hypothetical protein